MGEILDFKTDSERYKYFHEASKEHPAKLEVRTFRWLVERYTKPGDTILDPMAGIGTVHLAATMGRNTIAVEINPRFVEIQHLNIQRLNETLGINANTAVLCMDCRRALPLPPGSVSCIIFSPPYGSVQKRGITHGLKIRKPDSLKFSYDEQDANVGNITVYPMYLLAMREIYALCNRTLLPGQRMILITKDYVQNYERIYVSKDNVRVATEVGFELEDWHLRLLRPTVTASTSRKHRQQKGLDRPELNILQEDILVLVKTSEA